MKVCSLLLISLAIVATVKGDHEEFKASKAECIESSGVDAEEIEKMKKGEFTDEPKLKEFLFCLGKKTGCINDAGELQLDFIKSKFTEHIGADKAETVFTECIPHPETETGAEATFELAKCFYEKSHHHFNDEE